MSLIIISSIALQLTAALLALRLIPETGHRISWSLISLSLAGMVYRRIHTLMLAIDGTAQPDMAFELIGLGVSAIVLVGIILIRPIFRQLREANEQLVVSEKRFRTVADFTHDWEYWRGQDGSFLYMSPSCERITGYTREEFFSEPELMERIIHPEDRERITPHLTLERRKGDTATLDFRIIAKDGSTHWIAHRCMPVVDEHGNFSGTRANNRNIDCRKNAEAMLRQSRRLYRNLVEQSHSIILELNMSGEILFINRFGQDFYGYSEQELAGKQAVGLLLPEKDSEGRDMRTKLSELDRDEMGCFLCEAEVLRKNGSKAYQSLATSLVRNREGFPEGILCAGVDITARKAAEKLREDVERIVRHDLKSPLMGIIGLPRLLRKADNLTDKQREMLTVMEGAGMQMMDLINQSLTLYKLESGTYRYHPADTDWLEIIQRAVRDLQAQRSGDQTVEITLDGSPADEDAHLVIPGDPTLLYGMVANLLKNALESSDNKPVRVDLTSDDPCTVEIRNALAVPEEIRNTFFDKYATSGKGNGTGLGTYSARLAVKAHGGEIAMQTDTDTGTVVRVELPKTFDTV